MVAEIVEPRTNGRKPENVLLAAAKRLTGKTVERVGTTKEEKGNEWQTDAIDLTRLVGEQQFIVSTLAGRVSQARLFAGKLNQDDPTAKPETVEKGHVAAKVLEAFGDTPGARSQILNRSSENLSVPGVVYIVGIPEKVLKGEDKPKPTTGIAPDGDDGNVDIEDLKWYALSIKECKKERGQYELTIDGKKRLFNPSDIWLMKVWNSDPQEAEKATSPTRGVLPVLRELVGLTMHVSAQIDSRLAGAGLFFTPQEALQAIMRQMPEDYEGEDPVGDAMYEAMTAAIRDRANASALAPVNFIVPAEWIEYFRKMDFATPLDKEARHLREEAIRRLALGQNVPPEILLGVGGMNHWGAWLVREDTISTHVEPQLALICDALTTEYLWPVLVEQGMKESEAQQYVIWYDVDHLIARPNRLEDAIALHQADAISDAALRDAAQFTDEDAKVEVTGDEAASIVLKLITSNPSLIRNPGTESLLESIRLILKGEGETAEEGAAPEDEQPVDPLETPLPTVSEEGPPR